MKKNIKPFKVEQLRSLLAVQRQYKKLRSTYNESYAEIKDLNTPKLWDHLNIEGRKEILTNPMEVDRLKTVASWINGSNSNILNVGFGSANLEEEYFLNRVLNCREWYGIDISTESVKNAMKKITKAKFKIGSIDKIEFSNDYFDYVISLEVLEHIKPRVILKSLHEIFRVIRPGGFIIVSVPLNEGLEEMLDRGENPNAHVRTYTPELIKAELEISGFTVKKDKKLFAFNNAYKVKSLLAKTILKDKFHYNNIILKAQKPVK